MFWQIVSFTFPPDSGQRRNAFEDALRGLPAQIPALVASRVSRDEEQPDVSGYISCFLDEAAFRRYLEHPAHARIVEAAAQLCGGTHRLLMTTDDDVSVWRSEIN